MFLRCDLREGSYINGTMRSYPGVTIEEYDQWLEMTPEENREETTEPASALTVNVESGNPSSQP